MVVPVGRDGVADPRFFLARVGVTGGGVAWVGASDASTPTLSSSSGT